MSLIILHNSEKNIMASPVERCGANSFFNSVNYMLFHIPEFREFLINNSDKFNDEYIVIYIALLKVLKYGITIQTTDSIHYTYNGIKKSKVLYDFYLDTEEKFFHNRYILQLNADNYLNNLLNFIYNDFFNNKNLISFNINSQIRELLAIKYNFDFFYKWLINKETKCNTSTIQNKLYYDNIISRKLKGEFKNNILKFQLSKLSREIEIKEKVGSYDNCETKYNYYSNSKYIFIQFDITSEGTGKNKIFLNEFEINNTTINYVPDFIFDGKRYEIIGTIVNSDNLGSVQYWYNHKFDTEWWTFSDSVQNKGFKYADNDNIRIMLLRQKGRIYDYFNYNYDEINKNLLYNTISLLDTLKDFRSKNLLKISLNILTSYSNFYYNNYKKIEYKDELENKIKEIEEFIKGSI